MVGLPGNDIRSDITFTRDEVCSQLNLPLDMPYILVLQHSVTHTYTEVSMQIEETLQAVCSLKNPILLANPNDDAGGRVILAKMKEYASRYRNIHILPPVSSRELFASIMFRSGVLVGNSSTGVVEAMSIGLPVVNIGDRQSGREHLARMINVDYDSTSIRDAIQKALHDTNYRSELEDFCKNMSWLDTPTEVIKCLLAVDLDVALSPKSFVDLPITHTSENL